MLVNRYSKSAIVGSRNKDSSQTTQVSHTHTHRHTPDESTQGRRRAKQHVKYMLIPKKKKLQL